MSNSILHYSLGISQGSHIPMDTYGFNTLRFFSSKYSLFHNSKIFGSCVIHIFYTGCVKFKKIIPELKG